jgi:hypothetical protein
MGPVSAVRLPTCRHLLISGQPRVVPRVSQLEEGRGVTPLLPAHDRRVPRLEGIWHRPCLDSLAPEPRAQRRRQRAAGSVAGRLLPLSGGAMGETKGDRRRAR